MGCTYMSSESLTSGDDATPELIRSNRCGHQPTFHVRWGRSGTTILKMPQSDWTALRSEVPQVLVGRGEKNVSRALSSAARSSPFKSDSARFLASPTAEERTPLPVRERRDPSEGRESTPENAVAGFEAW